jgi:O-antigen ligase
VLTLATLTGPLPKLGVITLALLTAVTFVGRDPRLRAWTMVAALILAPALLLDAIWTSPQLDVIHRHPLETIVGAVVVVIAVAAFAAVLMRWPRLIAPLCIAALPFRIPIAAGSHTYELLVPLYFVVAAGTLASVVTAVRSTPTPRPPRHLFEWILGGYLVLYAVQAWYSVDFFNALRTMVFFYVPFALMLALLRDQHWDRELLRRCLVVTVALAIVFSGIAFVEEATKSVFLNSKLAENNQVHSYFTVNSVFFDPNIFGRYLSLVMIVVLAVVLFDERPRIQLAATGTLAVLWSALVFTISRSSLAALLLGMAVLAAIRWRLKPVLIVGAVVLVIGAIAVAIRPTTFGLNQGLNGASAGRAGLVSGGLRMFGDRPGWGYGSGSFAREFHLKHPNNKTGLYDSHTIPITVAAEQGVIGLTVYAVLVLTALLALFRGIRGDPWRTAIAAAFLALLLHTLLYAGFLEDPLTWTLLAIGGALAALPPAPKATAESDSETAEVVAAG